MMCWTQDTSKNYQGTIKNNFTTEKAKLNRETKGHEEHCVVFLVSRIWLQVLAQHIQHIPLGIPNAQL